VKARNALTFVGLIFGLLVGYYVERLLDLATWSVYQTLGMVILIGALFGILIYILSPWLIRSFRQFTQRIESRVAKVAPQELVWGAIGLILGLVAGYLLTSPLSSLPIVGQFLPIIVSVLLGYVGLVIGVKKREDLGSVSSFIRRDRDREKKEKEATKPAGDSPKILDTSVVIDGRILDVLKSGFLEGTIVVPAFVLEELRHIADSADVLKRNRGRRGLDILNRIQKDLEHPVKIMEHDFGAQIEVDMKLLRLAKFLGGKVLTNDYNLNKVAALEGVPVLNINELANAVKPVVLPGEEMVVNIVKDGKEPGQGVAYLDDGTMIVVENGRRFIGDSIEVLVTSVLQTAAGRMIFAKPKVHETGGRVVSQT